VRVRFGNIKPAGDDIRLADSVNSAALRHRLAESDHPRT
jgi:hypothetical protein